MAMYFNSATDLKCPQIHFFNLLTDVADGLPKYAMADNLPAILITMIG
jgi:hypothetical protein